MPGSTVGELYAALSISTEAWTAGLAEAASAGEDFTTGFLASLAKVDESVTALADRMAGLRDSFAGAGEGASAAAKAVTDLTESAAAGGDAAERLAALEREAGTAGDAMAAGQDAARASLAGLRDDAAAAGDSVEGLAAKEKAAGDAADSTAAKNDASGASFAALGSKGKLALLGIAGATTYAVVKAAEFQTQMTRLYSAAGLTGHSMAQVSQQVLKIGDATGYTGTQIAEALYHPVSAGMDLKAALAAVDQGAKLAQIHGASLDDTMYALSSVMKSFGIEASGAGQTAALLNSIVGQGDMRFQDFNQSVKNWAPTAASMGISIRSMGSAIAYLTDRGNSAEVASTRLTMGLSMITAGSKETNQFLGALGLATGDAAQKNMTLTQVMQSYGLTTTRIASDLRKPDGIYAALRDLQDAFRASGLSADQANQVMAKMFGGGRSDKAILSLMSHLGQLKTKYEDIGKGVKGYGKSWSETQQTVTQQWHQAMAQVQNLAISFGSVLLPAVKDALHGLQVFMGWMQKYPLVRDIAGALLAAALAAGTFAAAGAALDAVLSPVTLVVLAVAGLVLGLVALYRHFKLVRDIVADVGRFFTEQGRLLAAGWHQAMRLAGDAVTWFVNGPLAFIRAEVAQFSQWWAQHGQEVKDVTRVAWAFVSLYVKSTLAILAGVIKVFLGGVKDTWDFAWGLVRDTVVTAWHLIANTIRTGVSLIEGIVGVFLDLVTGHWSKAWHGLLSTVTTFNTNVRHLLLQFTGDALTLLYNAGRNLLLGLIHGVESMAGAVKSTVTGIGHDVLSTFKSVFGISSPSRVTAQYGEQLDQGVSGGLDSGRAGVASSARGVGHTALSALAETLPGSQGDRIGAGLGDGVASGLGASTGAVAAAAANVGRTALSALAEAITGAMSGLTATIPAVRKGAPDSWDAAFKALAGSLGGGGEGAGSGGGSGSSGLSKVRDAINSLIGTIRSALTGLKGTASQVASSVKSILDGIARAYQAGDISKSADSKLVDWVKDDNAKLTALANERAAIAAKIQAADSYDAGVLSSLSSFSALSGLAATQNAGTATAAAATGTTTTTGGSVTSVLSDAGGVQKNTTTTTPGTTTTTGGGTSTGATPPALTAQNILSGLKADLAKIRQFGADIRKLKALGLDKNLLNQIVQMGPVQGTAVAEALIEAATPAKSGGGGTNPGGPVTDGPFKGAKSSLAQAATGIIAQLNGVQSQISSASSSVAAQATVDMYNSGVATAKGFVNGLKAQEKELAAEMKHIADQLVRELRKQLRIHSPSGVMHDEGLMVPAGIASGIDAGGPLIVAAMKRVTGLVTGTKIPVPHLTVLPGGALGGTPGTRPDLTVVPGGHVGGTGGGTVVNITVHNHIAGSVTSERDLRDTITASVQDRLKRNWNSGMTQRGRSA